MSLLRRPGAQRVEEMAEEDARVTAPVFLPGPGHIEDRHGSGCPSLFLFMEKERRSDNRIFLRGEQRSPGPPPRTPSSEMKSLVTHSWSLSILLTSKMTSFPRLVAFHTGAQTDPKNGDIAFNRLLRSESYLASFFSVGCHPSQGH